MRRPHPLALVLAALTFVLLGLRWVDAAPLAPVQAAWPWLAFLTVLVAAASSLRGAHVLAFLPALALVVMGTVSDVGGQAPRAAVGEFTVFAADAHRSTADVSALVGVSASADVVVLTEVDETFVRQYLRGRPDLTARTGTAGTDPTRGAVVLSRFPLRQQTTTDTARQQPAASLATPGGPVAVRAANVAPGPAWRGDLRDLRTWADAQQAPTVVLGGFDATTDQPAFRDLRDHLPEAGLGGWPFTWPAESPVPFLRPDHVLVRGLHQAGGGVTPLAGSDHRAVWAQLAHR